MPADRDDSHVDQYKQIYKLIDDALPAHVATLKEQRADSKKVRKISGASMVRVSFLGAPIFSHVVRKKRMTQRCNLLNVARCDAVASGGALTPPTAGAGPAVCPRDALPLCRSE